LEKRIYNNTKMITFLIVDFKHFSSFIISILPKLSKLGVLPMY
jgi:hypothetical protein